MDQVTQTMREHASSNTFTRKYMDDVKQKLGIESDYALAKHLQVSRSAVSSYARGRSFFCGGVSHRVAAILGLEPALVVASVDVDRSGSSSQKELETRKFILEIMATQLGQKTQRGFASLSMMLVIFAISLLAAQAGFTAQIGKTLASSSAASVYYVKSVCKVVVKMTKHAKTAIAAAVHWMRCSTCAYA